jgi:glyoxylase-like metal-dependent hydrolase (beta-lactamase superfamily II)
MRIAAIRVSSAFVSLLLSLAAATPAMAQAPAPAHAAEPPFKSFKIGQYEALALYDGRLDIPNDGKSFVVDRPPAEVATLLKSRGAPTDHFELSIEPLLVRAGSRVLLFDTGGGTNMGDTAGKLPQSLASARIDPSTVTDIFISHAHGDHVGGLVTPGGTLAFPKASIHISAPEWKWLSSMSPDEARQLGIQQQPALVAAIRPKVVPFEPGAVILPGIVTAVDIKGHTPGHSAYQIGSNTHGLLFIGDAMHSYIISVARPSWKIEFDTDQNTAAASRIALVKQAASTGERLYVEHFPFPGVGKLTRTKNETRWSPEL